MLLKLPLEILREVLAYAIQVRNVKRALRLRLVNHLFSVEVLRTFYDSQLLLSYVDDANLECDSSASYEQFWRQFLISKIMAIKIPEQGAPNFIRQIAEHLCKLTGVNAATHLQSYVEKMCYDPTTLMRFTKSKHQRFQPNDAMIPRYLLQAAAINNLPDVVQEILDQDGTPASILDSAYDGELLGSPCWLAGRSANLETIKKVLASSFGDMDMKREEALKGAIASGCLEAVDLVLQETWGPSGFVGKVYIKNGPLLNGMLNSSAVDFCTRLYELINSYRPYTWNSKLSESTVQDMQEEVAGSSPQRPDLVGHLLDMEKSPFNRNSHKQLLNPLLEAISGGNEKVVELLLSRGATPGGPDLNIVKKAAAKGRMDIVRLLVENGFPVNLRKSSLWGDTDPDPEQAIVGAVLAEHEEMCLYLLDKGADLTMPRSGQKALILAQRQGLESMVKFLEDRGVRHDPDFEDSEDEDLYQYSASDASFVRGRLERYYSELNDLEDGSEEYDSDRDDPPHAWQYEQPWRGFS